MSYCKVCRKSSHKKPATTFFRFPKESQKCEIWATNCNLLKDFHNKGSEYFYKTYRICSDHFSSHFIRWSGKKKCLLPNAVPEIPFDHNRKPVMKQSIGVDHETEQRIDEILECDDSEFRLQMVDHLCRFCCEEGPRLSQIFGQYGINLGLPEKIKYIPVKVVENDVMPSKICRSCIKKVEDNFRFFNDCLESDKKIRTMLDVDNQDTTYEIE